MTTDNQPKQQMNSEDKSKEYVPSRELPMPAYHFQTPSQFSGGLSASQEGVGVPEIKEPAKLHNVSIS
jgi:hypothetical protein